MLSWSNTPAKALDRQGVRTAKLTDDSELKDCCEGLDPETLGHVDHKLLKNGQEDGESSSLLLHAFAGGFVDHHHAVPS